MEAIHPSQPGVDRLASRLEPQKINKERKGFVFNVSFCKKQPMKWRDQHYTKGRTKTIINAKSQKKLAKSFVCGKTIAAIMRKSRSQSVRKFLNK